MTSSGIEPETTDMSSTDNYQAKFHLPVPFAGSLTSLKSYPAISLDGMRKITKGLSVIDVPALEPETSRKQARRVTAWGNLLGERSVSQLNNQNTLLS